MHVFTVAGDTLTPSKVSGLFVVWKNWAYRLSCGLDSAVTMILGISACSGLLMQVLDATGSVETVAYSPGTRPGQSIGDRSSE